MIILHDHKLIFLKPRKVAGTSFEIALSQFAGPDDVITPISAKDEEQRSALGFAGPRNFRLPPAPDGTPRKFARHLSARGVRHLLGTKLWSAYTKVAIIRDPFDVAISAYFYSHKRLKAENSPPFSEWCLANTEVLSRNHEQYLIDGRPVLDHVIRYGHLAQDIHALELIKPGLHGLYRTFTEISTKAHTRPPQATKDRMFRDAAPAQALIERLCRYELDVLYGQDPAVKSTFT